MKDLSGDDFDKMVSKLKTTDLTDNTTRATELPDMFEPDKNNVLNFARMIP